MSVAVLKNKNLFRKTIKEGQKISFPAFILMARRASLPEDSQGMCFVGVAVGRKLGNAVVRNYMKRRVREAVRQVFKGYEAADSWYMVIIARKRCEEISFYYLTRELAQAIGKLKEEHKK